MSVVCSILPFIRLESHREAEWLSNQFCASIDFTRSPATCLVVTLRRFRQGGYVRRR